MLAVYGSAANRETWNERGFQGWEMAERARHMASHRQPSHRDDGRKDGFLAETYYGFIRDSGHFLGFPTGDGFTAKIRIQGEFRTLYDQAGLMLRIDETREDRRRIYRWRALPEHRGSMTASPIGRCHSPSSNSRTFIRVTAAGGALRVQASRDGTFWPLLRLAPFPVASAYEVVRPPARRSVAA